MIRLFVYISGSLFFMDWFTCLRFWWTKSAYESKTGKTLHRQRTVEFVLAQFHEKYTNPLAIKARIYSCWWRARILVNVQEMDGIFDILFDSPIWCVLKQVYVVIYKDWYFIAQSRKPLRKSFCLSNTLVTVTVYQQPLGFSHRAVSTWNEYSNSSHVLRRRICVTFSWL